MKAGADPILTLSQHSRYMRLPLFLARRVFADKGADGGADKGTAPRVSRPVTRIATAGVAAGLAVMIVSVSVVLGFKHTVRDKVIGMGAPITVANYFTLQGDTDIPLLLNDSLMDALRGVSGTGNVQRYALKQGMMKTDDDFLGVMLKGVAEEYDTSFIHGCIVEGSIPTFSARRSGNQILISRLMADKLRLKTGDKVYAYFLSSGEQLRARRFTVAGVYRTDLSLFDKNIVLTDLYTTAKLNGWQEGQASGAEITVGNTGDTDGVFHHLIYDMGSRIDSLGVSYVPATAQELYPQIFSWLDLMDLNVWIILALMTCVAAVTMISGLLIIILERTNMIGILKAMGARNSTIRHTFLWLAAFIIGRGMLIGDIIGLALVGVQQATGLIRLDPTSYYVDTVPVEINVPLIIIINVATLLINVFILVAPSFIISNINPVKSMRYE